MALSAFLFTSCNHDQPQRADGDNGDTVNPAACTKDSDCNEDSYCNGTCVPKEKDSAEKVLCKNGVPNAGPNGDGHCKSCHGDWSGPDCDLAKTCQHGSAKTGVKGDGSCEQCDEGWLGPNCDIKKQCVNGILDELTGDCQSDSCTGNWVGIDCAVENKCVNGTVDELTGDCQSDSCTDNWVGIDCAIENKCVNGTVDELTGDCQSDSCIGGWSGVDCDECTLPEAEGSKGKDNKVEYVIINCQKWMSRNAKLNQIIEHGEEGIQFVDPAGVYNPDPGGNEDYKRIYGQLMTWEVAKEACPDGWRLPEKKDFEDLLTYVDAHRQSPSTFKALINGNNPANMYGVRGRDEFGFNASLAGYCSGYELFGSISCTYFNNTFTYRAYFWSGTEASDSQAYNLELASSKCRVIKSNKLDGNSVRCIKEND